MNPTDRELDALKEVTNIGAGHAATALSKLVGGRKVGIEVARARLVDAKAVPELVGPADEPVVAALFGMTGALSGHVSMILPEDAAQALCGMLLGAPCRVLDAASEDAFREAANIFASACLSAVGQLTGLRLLPTIPDLLRASASVVARRLVEGTYATGGVALVMETCFFSPPITGHLFLLPAPEAVRPLLERLGT